VEIVEKILWPVGGLILALTGFFTWRRDTKKRGKVEAERDHAEQEAEDAQQQLDTLTGPRPGIGNALNRLFPGRRKRKRASRSSRE
jgi:hypothetical protein